MRACPVNEEKTRICIVPEGEFDFLGYTFGRMYVPKELLDFLDSGMLQFFGFELCPYRSKDSI